jgi:excisionase family DNA binding protein
MQPANSPADGLVVTDASPVSPAPPPDVLLTADEMAALLKVPPKSVYAMAAEGALPGVRRLGRRLRFYRPEVLAWLEGNRRTTRRPL